MYIAVSINTAVVVYIGVGMVLRIIQRGVIISNVAEIIFVIDTIFVGFGFLHLFTDSYFTSIYSI